MNVRGIALPDSERHYIADYVGERYPALDVALQYCAGRRTAIDIGAHVGLWSKWLVQEFAFVHAFEPVKEHADLYEKNVSANRWLHRFALGAEFGKVAIKQYPDNTGQAHVCGFGDIEMRTLDSFGISGVDLVKIDVEGYELPVCKGSEETLRKNQPIVVIEQRGLDVDRFDGRKDEALHWLESLGMKRIECVHFDWILGW